MSNLKRNSRKSPEVMAKIAEIEVSKRNAEVVTLREWYDSSPVHSPEILAYMKEFKQLGRLGKELHIRNATRVTERYGDSIGTLVEATYQRGYLDMMAPLCALACLAKKQGLLLSYQTI
ncbi:hypothetical protein AB4490_17220 [Vibrio cyclitrophicus]